MKDGASYTDIEKDTMAYIRDNYKWTDATDDWFRTEIRKWVATKQAPLIPLENASIWGHFLFLAG